MDDIPPRPPASSDASERAAAEASAYASSDPDAREPARSPNRPDPDRPRIRLRRIQDLADAVPYLLGFAPARSAVLVGIGPAEDAVSTGLGRVTVVARMDLADLDPTHEPSPGAVRDFAASSAQALVRSGARTAIGLLYLDHASPEGSDIATMNLLDSACAGLELAAGGWLVVGEGRLSLYPCGAADGAAGVSILPPEGTSTVAAEATYAGLVAQPSREALAQTLCPRPDAERERLRPGLDRARLARARSIRAGSGERSRRASVRALFAATRTLAVLDAASAIRLGAALNDVSVRDSCWLAIERGRIDGDALWRELACALPDDYAAAPLFLFGWLHWRQGDGTLAAIAIRRALECDPDYRAAHLLDSALMHGLDPFSTPRLRKGA